MAEIKYRDHKKYIKELLPEEAYPVYLIYGEEFFYKIVFNTLLEKLLPDTKKNFNCDKIDGVDGSAFDVTHSLQTYSLLSDTKVVAFCDTRIFYSKEDERKLLDKATAEAKKNNPKKAAKILVQLLSVLDLSFDRMEGDKRYTALKIDPESEDRAWLDSMISYCIKNNITIPPKRDQARVLQDAIEKGPPKNNLLMITTDRVDKRKGLYKTIKNKGMVIDCSVPKGNRFADKQAKETMLKESMRTVLSESGKKLSPNAFQEMIEYTGFDFPAFIHNLEKLINYAGDETVITIENVHAVLKRTKQDPVFELTGALSERNVERSLFYVRSLLSKELFPLQVLSAMVNQIRRLLVAKDFLESSRGRSWHHGTDFNRFKTDVMHDAIDYDNDLLTRLEESAYPLSGMQEAVKKSRKNKKQTDLLIAGNPNNPYPVYQLLLKAEKFSKNDLLDALDILGQADLRLKTTGIDPKLILDDAIIHICRMK